MKTAAEIDMQPDAAGSWRMAPKATRPPIKLTSPA